MLDGVTLPVHVAPPWLGVNCGSSSAGIRRTSAMRSSVVTRRRGPPHGTKFVTADPSAIKKRLTEIERDLDLDPVVELCRFETPRGHVVVSITDRLERSCRKGKVWKSHAMLTAIKNAQYGLDPTRLRSRGGADGVFLVDRSFRPANEMMRKLFDRFLDKPDPLVAVLASRLATRPEDLIPVRVVSHHLRLLGLLIEQEKAWHLVLVDYDDT